MRSQREFQWLEVYALQTSGNFFRARPAAHFRMLDAAPARGALLEIFARQRTIDSERGTRAFRGRDDR